MKSYQEISMELAPLLNALSHPASLKILLHLSEYRGCQAGSISERLPLAKSTVSEYLNRLKEVKLIQCNSYGGCQKFTINTEMLSALQIVINGLFRKIEVAREDSILCKEQHIVDGTGDRIIFNVKS